MNMISTGAFQTEMDASNKQPTLAKKFAALWEKKNAKTARAGGVSLMSLSLAACGSDDATTTATTATTATTTTTTTTPVVDAAMTVVLGSGLDNSSGGSGDDLFKSTNATLQASDILKGGDGSDTLEYVDTSATGTAMPTVALTDVETISVRNLSGTAATAGTSEVATVTTGALQNGQFMIVAGQTVTASKDATAAEVASVLNGGTVANVVLSGTLTAGYTKAAGVNTDEVTYTATTVGNKANLEVTGNASVDVKQVNIIAFTGAIDGIDTLAITMTINGVAVTADTVAKNASATIQGQAIAAAINGYAGENVASYAVVSATAGAVQIVSDNILNVANLKSVSSADGAAGSTTAFSSTNVLAPSTQTVQVTGVTDSKTSTFMMNGETVNVATTDGTATATEAAVLLKDAINTQFGVAIATSSTDTVTIDSGDLGLAIGGFSSGGSSGINGITLANTVTSGGKIATDATVISTANGTAAVAAASNAQTVDGSLWTGVDTVKNYASSDAVTFSNLQANMKAVVESVTAGAAATTDVQFAAAVVKGATTSATLELTSNTSSGAITIGDASGNGVETLNIVATGKNTVSSITSNSASAVTLSADAATDVTISSGVASKGTLTVTGAGKVTLNTLDTAFDTVDASGNSGGIVVTDVDANETVYTLSSGADTFTTAADGFATTDKFAVNAGDGVDIMVVTAAADMDTAAEAARYTNFETMTVSDSQDMSLVSGITAINVGTMTNKSLTKVSADQAKSITVTGNQSTALTIALNNATGTADVVNVDLKSATATTNVDAILKVAGVETLNVTGSTGTAATDSDVSFAAGGATTLSAVNLSGTADMTISGANTAKAIAMTSTSSGAITATGAFIKASTITTGAGKDEVTLSTNNGSTYNTGAGIDKITSAVAQLVATGTDDHKVDGGADADTLIISDTAATTLTDNHFTNVSNVETLQASTTGANLSITTGAAFNAAFGDAATISAVALTGQNVSTIATGLFTGATTVSLTTTNTGATAAKDITVTTGSGADTVTVSAAGFVGANGNSDGGSIVVSTGLGADTISVTHGTLTQQATSQVSTITAGGGADKITLAGTNFNDAQSVTHIVTANGDSVVGAYDTIIGYRGADNTNTRMGDLLDLTAATVGTSIGSTDSGTILSHSLTAGKVSFDDAGTYAAAVVVNAGNLDDVTGYLNANLGANTTVVFEYDRDSNGTTESSMVFTNIDNTGGVGDTLIMLQDVLSAGMSATATFTTTDDYVIIG
jgi:hypothetical protein